MTALPPERDLPPGRHARIRAELERTVIAGAARSFRPRLAPVAAAAAAVILLGATAALATLPDGPSGPAAGPQPTGDPPTLPTEPTLPTAPTVPTTPAAGGTGPVLPGLTDERVREIERGCLWSSTLGHEPEPPGQPATTPTSTANPPADDVRLYNVVRNGAGHFAYLYGAQVALLCTIDSPAMPYNSGFTQVSDDGSANGLIEADYLLASQAGGDTPGNKASYRGLAGVDQAAGRIGAGVARLTLTVDADTVDAVLANGTFLASIERPSTWSIPENPRSVVLKAYDAAGTLVDELVMPTG